MATGPKKATLWAYDVGFGDCILLELTYVTATRFVLFDFGSKGAAKTKGKKKAPKKKGDGALLKIALDIEQRIKTAKKGSLVAIVATHRHQDHISGFMPGSKNDGPGSVIKRLKPGVVVQPWTDTPGTRARWRGPGKGLRVGGPDALGLQPGTLDLAQRFAELAVDEAEIPEARFAETTSKGILSAASNNVPNVPAVNLLRTVCPKSKHDYVYAGSKATNLQKALPGVSVKVLGPPTLHQHDEIFKSYREKSPEYWSLRFQLSDEHTFWRRAAEVQSLSGAALNGRRGRKLFSRRYAAKHTSREARWLIERIDQNRGESLFELVRAADNVLNNTSVILLLKVGKARLLFPGDAQLENWEYALKHATNAASIRKELAKTDLYKVGHHGSLNATPKASLWDAFDKTGPASKKNRLVTVMSTARGYFGGKSGAETEVPRKTLVKELRAKSDYRETARKKKGELAVRLDVPI